jgi:hypothetical protein
LLHMGLHIGRPVGGISQKARDAFAPHGRTRGRNQPKGAGLFCSTWASTLPDSEGIFHLTESGVRSFQDSLRLPARKPQHRPLEPITAASHLLTNHTAPASYKTPCAACQFQNPDTGIGSWNPSQLLHTSSRTPLLVCHNCFLQSCRPPPPSQLPSRHHTPLSVHCQLFHTTAPSLSLPPFSLSFSLSLPLSLSLSLSPLSQGGLRVGVLGRGGGREGGREGG